MAQYASDGPTPGYQEACALKMGLYFSI